MRNKLKKQKKISNFRDVTLNDSANSERKSVNLTKKSGIAHTITQSHEIEEVDDFMDDIGKAGKGKNKKKPDEDNNSESGIELPIEIWIIISQKLRPEDVLTFCLISRKTNDVVNTPQFWFHLYKRYYDPTKTDILPIRLRKESMVRLGQLRSCVIRMLFITYDPFVKRISKPTYGLSSTKWNKKQRLVGMWSHQVKEKQWRFFFKLQNPAISTTSRRKTNYEDLVNFLDNPEDGCQLLIIDTPNFQPFPSNCFDQVLFMERPFNHLSLGLENRLQINLSNNLHTSNITIKLIFHPVINFKLLDWWHPVYNQELQSKVEFSIAEFE